METPPLTVERLADALDTHVATLHERYSHLRGAICAQSDRQCDFEESLRQLGTQLDSLHASVLRLEGRVQLACSLCAAAGGTGCASESCRGRP